MIWQLKQIPVIKVKKKFPIHPANPERNCWGCDKYCASNAMMCGNGSDRTQHPFELFGENWQDWGSDYAPEPVEDVKSSPAIPAKNDNP